ncbi:MAG: hypothetical protein RL040_39 [Bacteroidota bacterium]|jgi:hypothetical protein
MKTLTLARAIWLFAVMLPFTSAYAQQGTIRGFVKDQETAQPVIFILVGLDGTGFGTQTDENGFYTLTKIPDGKYTLVINQFGFKEVRDEIEIAGAKVVARNYFLVKDDVMMSEVEITDKGSAQKNNVNISVESMRTKDIKRIPSVGGAPDLAQALTTLPGFVSTGDQGGQIYVRGGSPVQNKVLLDGMIVYNAFHSIGLFSVFDTDIIANADVYTGGFSAQFGGRISSIMDITTRDGNKREIDGHVGVNPFGAKLQIEGPLRKLRENGSGISYVFSAKNSYLDRSSKLLYSNVNDGNGLPFNYTDIYGKMAFSGANGSKFNAFGFSFTDGVTSYKSLASLNWKNNGAGGNFVIVPSSSAVLITGNFARSKYEIVMSELNNPDRTSRINSFNFGLDFKYGIKNDVLKYGVEVVGFSTDYKTFALLDNTQIVQETQNTTELNTFFDYKLNRGRWVVEPSIRFQYYSTLSVFSPEPRLGIKYKLSERFRLKAATGRYTQNLMATNSDRDVVNLFYGFLASPENGLQSEYTGDPLFQANGEAVNSLGQIIGGTLNGSLETGRSPLKQQVKNPLQTAKHFVFGFEFDISERWNLNVESYYKRFGQQTNINRNKIFENPNGENNDKPEEITRDFVIETGNAYGTDIVLKYEDKSYYLNMVYSIAKVERWDGVRYYAPVFDRRHNLNLIGTYLFGKEKCYELSMRWNLGSGLPFTQTQGFYNGQDASQGISLDYLSNNSQFLSVQYADLNGGRLPFYHRLDVNIKRTFKLSKKTSLELNAGVTNAYNRANVFYIDRITGERIDQLPLLPTIGLDFSF